MTVEIHSATPADAATISELNRIVQTKHVKAVPWLFKDAGWEPDAVRGVLARPESIILLARNGSDAAGYIYADARTFPETTLTHAYQAVHVHHLSVRDDYRRRGVATALLAAVNAAAHDRGITRLTADIWAFNQEAIAFFTRRGLTPYLLRHWH